mgnify:CR=1 FL=1
MRRFLLIFLVTGLAASCSSTSFMYNNAPWYLRDKVDDYFSLSRIQEQRLDEDIELFFIWHRQNELPLYADLLSRFNTQFGDGLSRTEATLLVDQIIAARTRFVEASLAPASAFLATINPAQVDYYDSAFYARQAEKKAHLKLSAEAQYEKKFADLVDSLEQWFGELDDAQLVKLREINPIRSFTPQQRIARHEQRHRQFIALLRTKPDRTELEAYLRNRFSVPEGTAEVAQNDGWRSAQDWIELILRIDQIFTPAQRQHAINRVTDYQDSLIALNHQGDQNYRPSSRSRR